MHVITCVKIPVVIERQDATTDFFLSKTENPLNIINIKRDRQEYNLFGLKE